MFEEYDRFQLVKNIPSAPEIPIGQVGVVLMKYAVAPPNINAYEVEFVIEGGYNLGDATYTITEDMMGVN